MSWMRSTRISSLPLRSSLSYSRQAQEHNVQSQFLLAHVLTVRRQLRLCTSLPLSPVFPICPAAPMMPGIPRDPSRPCGPCGPGEPGGPGGPGGPMTPAPPSTALWALTATAASLSVRALSISISMGFASEDEQLTAQELKVKKKNKKNEGALPHRKEKMLTLQHLQHHFDDVLVRCITSLEEINQSIEDEHGGRMTNTSSASWMRPKAKSSPILPGYPACPELPVLRGVPEVQATQVGPGLQVYQDPQ